MVDIQHKNITGADAAHPPFYPSESDPTTTLGAYRGWIKPSTGEMWIRNAANTAWLDVVVSGVSPALTAHITDTSDAHNASAISILDSAAQYTATNAEDALAEVLDALQAHAALTTDAHDASSISIVDTGAYFTATHVEGVLQELGAGGGGGVADLDDLTDVDVTTTPPTDGQALVFDVGDSLWKPGDVSGGGSGYTPPWVQLGLNKTYVAWGEGNPVLASHSLTSSIISAGPTPTNIGTSTIRMTKFRLPVTLLVQEVDVLTYTTGTGLYKVAIYEWGTGGSKIWDNGGLAMDPASNMVPLLDDTPFTLNANTNYAMCISAPATSTSAAFHSVPAPANLGQVYVLPVFPNDGMVEFAEAATTSGAMPSTLPTLNVPSSWTGTVPFFWLVGDAS